jgi:hypothetical protein
MTAKERWKLLEETDYKQGWRNTASEAGQDPHGAVEPIIIIIIIIIITSGSDSRTIILNHTIICNELIERNVSINSRGPVSNPEIFLALLRNTTKFHRKLLTCPNQCMKLEALWKSWWCATPLTVTFRRADAVVSIRCEIYQEVVLLFEYNARALWSAYFLTNLKLKLIMHLMLPIGTVSGELGSSADLAFSYQ